MKYTLPKSYVNAGLQVDIPEATLKKYRSETGSTKAAVDRWLYENGYMAKAEYEQANEKNEAKKPVKREFKVDQEKAAIIEHIANALTAHNDVENINIVNLNRLISFSLGNSNYEVTLVRKKQLK